MNEYTIIKSNRRTLSVEITSEKIIVRAPYKVSSKFIHDFINNKKDWIIKSKNKLSKQKLVGDELLYLGNPLIIKKSIKTYYENNILYINQFKDRKKEIKRFYLNSSRIVLSKRLNELALNLKFNYSKFKLSSAMTRWGSCSSKNTISLVFKLIGAPLEIIDYVIIHELVHTEIKNHQKDFWNEVNNFYPKYKKARRWLKENTNLLKLI